MAAPPGASPPNAKTASATRREPSHAVAVPKQSVAGSVTDAADRSSSRRARHTPITSSRVAPARESSSGVERPCAPAPGVAAPARGYPALKRPRQPLALTRDRSAALGVDPSTGPGPEIPAGRSDPASRPCPGGPGPDAMSDSSLQGDNRRELTDDFCSNAQRKLFIRPDGSHVVRLMPCDVKACEWCGPRLRVRWAREVAEVIAPVAGEVLCRFTVPKGEAAKVRRRRVFDGHELWSLPAPDDMTTFYTTAPVGDPVADHKAALASNFQAMPFDGRRRGRYSAGWAKVAEDLEQERAAKFRESLGECAGDVTASMERVETVARALGVFVARTPDAIVVKPMPNLQVEQRFYARIGLRRGWFRRQEAA